MPININSRQYVPVSQDFNRYHNAYKKNIDENLVITKNVAKERFSVENAININTNLREYLSVDEKKVLKEVFGDFENENRVNTPYNKTSNFEFTKGSLLDIKL